MSAPHASPRSALRESVASSTMSMNASDDGERCPQAVTGLEPQVERREDEERDDELDPEVVRIAGERVRPEDLLRAVRRRRTR